MSFTVKFFTQVDFDKNAALRRLGLNPGGRVQAAIDMAVLRFSQPFVPFDSGRTEKSAVDNAVSGHLWDRAQDINIPGSGEVIYPGPYAHYLYHGEIYGPNIPVFDDDSGVPTRFWSPPGKSKHPTGRPLKYKQDKHPLAGPHWIENMKAARMKDVIAEAEGAMKKGGG